MPAIRDEEVEDLAYEFRRRIAPILGNAELALDGAFGPVTPEQRDALEEIVGASEELGAVIGHAFEADEVEAVIAPGDSLPSAAPETVVPIVVESGFETLAVQLARSGHELLEGEPDGPHHAIVDCGVPTRADLEAVRKHAEREETVSLTVISTIDIESVPAPVLGISAIVSPTASAELLSEELPALVEDDTLEVAVFGPVDGTLVEQIASVEGVSTTEIDLLGEAIATADADVAVFDTAAGNIDPERLAALRDPSSPDHLPLVAVGQPPTGGKWTAIPGHPQFVHRPLSAVELAGEVLIALSESGARNG